MKAQLIKKFIFLFIAILTLSISTCFGQDSLQAKTKTVPVFKDGEAQIVPGFNTPDEWIRHDLWVETEFDTDGDGKLDRMHVSVTRPYQTDTEGLKLPVIYISSPYFGGTSGFTEGLFWNVRHELGEMSSTKRIHPNVECTIKRPIISNSYINLWVNKGYIIVHSSSPGTGLSQGSPTVGGENESLAPKAVIEWLCGKDNGYTEPYGGDKVKAYWSTGKVGMTGTSYNGTIPVAAATTGVDGLMAIIPVAPNTSYYLYYRSNGLVRHPEGYLGEDIDVIYDFIHSGDESKRAYNNATVRDKELVQGMDRFTGDYNDFWDRRDYLKKIGSMKAALLMSHGFNDWNVMPEHSYRIYNAAKSKGIPAQIYYHQQGHGGPPPMEMMNRWFTRYLHGIENGVENDYRAWIVRENDDNNNPTAYEDYPNPKASPVDFYLNAGAPEQGKLSTTKTPGQPKETLIDNFSFSGSILAQAEITNHRLIYVTPEIIKPIHISGVARIKIRLSCSKPAANLSIWVVSLPWNNRADAKITDNIITRGWADPQNYKSLTKSEPLKQGKFYELSFDLQPDDQIISEGQQIGLMIFSSDRDYTLWPDPGTELTIDLDKTILTLPIVGGIDAFNDAIKKD